MTNTKALRAAVQEMAKTHFEPNWRDKQDAARQMLIKSAPAMLDEIAALRAENARLREILTENATASAALTVRIVRDGWSETYTLHGATKDEVQRLLVSQNAARAVLKQENLSD
jgi:regulator of replication initiation timing